MDLELEKGIDIRFNTLEAETKELREKVAHLENRGEFAEIDEGVALLSKKVEELESRLNSEVDVEATAWASLDRTVAEATERLNELEKRLRDWHVLFGYPTAKEARKHWHNPIIEAAMSAPADEPVSNSILETWQNAGMPAANAIALLSKTTDLSDEPADDTVTRGQCEHCGRFYEDYVDGSGADCECGEGVIVPAFDPPTEPAAECSVCRRYLNAEGVCEWCGGDPLNATDTPTEQGDEPQTDQEWYSLGYRNGRCNATAESEAEIVSLRSRLAEAWEEAKANEGMLHRMVDRHREQKSRADRAEADCARMREALENVTPVLQNAYYYSTVKEIKAILSSTDAGKALLEERDRLLGEVRTLTAAVGDAHGEIERLQDALDSAVELIAANSRQFDKVEQTIATLRRMVRRHSCEEIVGVRTEAILPVDCGDCGTCRERARAEQEDE